MKLLNVLYAGAMTYVTVAGQGMLVLNTLEAASELMDRRWRNYSDRPRLIG
jgi:hypothetical protein